MSVKYGYIIEDTVLTVWEFLFSFFYYILELFRQCGIFFAFILFL